MRTEAPAKPAIAVSEKSSAWVNGKPRLSICTVMMPHMPPIAKPQSNAGTEIQRFTVGYFLTLAFPKLLIFRAPIGNIGAAFCVSIQVLLSVKKGVRSAAAKCVRYCP